MLVCPTLKRGLFIWMYSEHIAMLTTNTSCEYNMERGGGERAMCCQSIFLPNLLFTDRNRSRSLLKKKPNKAQAVRYLRYTGS